MDEKYLYFENLADDVEIAPGSIVSRVLYNDEQVKIIVFGFDAGQELADHTAPMPTTLHFLRGEADLTLDGEVRKAGAGTWVLMPPRLTHGIIAKTPVVMLLTMLKTPQS